MIKKIVLIVLSVLFGYLTYVAFMFGIDINLNLPLVQRCYLISKS